MTQPLDLLGVPIEKGDLVAYGVRYLDTGALNVGRVVDVVEGKRGDEVVTKIKVWVERSSATRWGNSPRVATLECLNRIVVIKKGADGE